MPRYLPPRVIDPVQTEWLVPLAPEFGGPGPLPVKGGDAKKGKRAGRERKEGDLRERSKRAVAKVWEGVKGFCRVLSF